MCHTVRMTERLPGGQPDTGQGVRMTPDPTALSAAPEPDTRRTGEPRLAAIGSWVVLSASFGLSAATWIALAALAGFDGQVTIPTLSGWAVTLRLAWLMPLAIDGYVVVALVLWTAPVPPRIAAFARKNTYAGALVGVAAQSAYHALTAWSATGVLWRAVLAAVVGAIIPGVAAVTVHIRALVRRESGRWRRPTVDIWADTVPVVPETYPVPGGADTPDTVRLVLDLDTRGAVADTPALPDADTPADDDRTPAADTATVTSMTGRTRRGGQSGGVSVETLADTLGARFSGRTVGLPTALSALRDVHGSCSKDRAIAAKNIHNARVAEPAAEVEDDDEDRAEVAV